VFLEVDAFSKFSTVVQKVAEAHPDMPLVRIVSLHLALLQFVIRVYQERLDCVDQVLVRPRSHPHRKGLRKPLAHPQHRALMPGGPHCSSERPPTLPSPA